MRTALIGLMVSQMLLVCFMVLLYVRPEPKVQELIDHAKILESVVGEQLSYEKSILPGK